jgi:nucleoside-diphosphate-sugar epimerase
MEPVRNGSREFVPLDQLHLENLHATLAEFGLNAADFDDRHRRTWNLWSYIDAGDGAQAVVRALGYDKPGFDNFVIANADTVMSRPSKELMAEFFPGTEFRAPVEGTQSRCSTEKARRLLGWKPQHSWRDHASA